MLNWLVKSKYWLLQRWFTLYMYLWLFWIPLRLISLLPYCYWNFLYMKTASKDCMIFEKQPVLIVRRIKVSIKDKSILCTKQCKYEMIAKTICLTYIYTGKPQMSAPETYWNPFQHALTCIRFYISLFVLQFKCPVELTAIYTNMGVGLTGGNWIKDIHLLYVLTSNAIGRFTVQVVVSRFLFQNEFLVFWQDLINSSEFLWKLSISDWVGKVIKRLLTSLLFPQQRWEVSQVCVRFL